MQHQKDFGFLPIPKYLAYDYDQERRLSLPLNILLGLTCFTTASNRDLCTPLLSVLANDFDVSYETISVIPTMVGGAMALGILFLCPAGDVWRRRPLILGSVACTMLFNIGQTFAPNAKAMTGLTFLANFSSVAFQVIVPFSADLAGPRKSGRAIAIVLFGLISGLYYARVTSGVIAEQVHWRVVFAIAAGLEAAVLTLLWFCLPNYPAKPVLEGQPSTYIGSLKSTLHLGATEPTLTQSWPCSLLANMISNALWTNLTFILSDPPFEFNSQQISLISLVGLAAVILSPAAGYLTDHMLHWTAILLGACFTIVAFVPFIAAGGTSLVAVIFTGMLFEIGSQQLHIASEARLQTVHPSMGSRLNCIYGFAGFVGTLLGGRPMATLYLGHGWRNLGICLICLAAGNVLALVVRGPQEPRTSWFGWSAGKSLRKYPKTTWPHQPDDASPSPSSEEDIEKRHSDILD